VTWEVDLPDRNVMILSWLALYAMSPYRMWCIGHFSGLSFKQWPEPSLRLTKQVGERASTYGNGNDEACYEIIDLILFLHQSLMPMGMFYKGVLSLFIGMPPLVNVHFVLRPLWALPSQ
jgi:hypothetical protein